MNPTQTIPEFRHSHLFNLNTPQKSQEAPAGIRIPSKFPTAPPPSFSTWEEVWDPALSFRQLFRSQHSRDSREFTCGVLLGDEGLGRGLGGRAGQPPGDADQTRLEIWEKHREKHRECQSTVPKHRSEFRVFIQISLPG